jgi:hypothetical protein
MHIYRPYEVLEYDRVLLRGGYPSAISTMVYGDDEKPTEEKLIILQKEINERILLCLMGDSLYQMYEEFIKNAVGLEDWRIVFIQKIDCIPIIN